jgi:hypothetical protein
MFHLKNNTPFVADIFLLPDRRGVDMLCIVVKATYDIESEVRISDNQQPIIMEDTYWGKPGESSLKYPAELHPEKPGTDVILIAEACAPEGRIVTEMFAGISAAGRKRIMKVSGDRYWKKGMLTMKPSEPEPFKRMPIIYEKAYGGTHVIDEKEVIILSEQINPIGMGFAGKRDSRELEQTSVPNIEDPECLMKSPSDKSRPVGCGAIAPEWHPRVSYAGTYDEVWQRERSPLLPDDFDPLYYHAAHPDFIFPDRLKGGEPFVISGMSPQGRKVFNLPQDEPKIGVDITGRFEAAKAFIRTVLLEPTDDRISIVWLASVAHGKRISGAEAKVAL